MSASHGPRRLRRAAIGVHTAPGTRYDELNQDESLVMRHPDSRMPSLLCVLDGHGIFGERISRVVKKSIRDQYSLLGAEELAPLPCCFCDRENPQGVDSEHGDEGEQEENMDAAVGRWKDAFVRIFERAHDDAVQSYHTYSDAPRVYKYGDEMLDLAHGDVSSTIHYKNSRGSQFLYEAGTCVLVVLVPQCCEVTHSHDADESVLVSERPCSLLVFSCGDCEVVVGGTLEDDCLDAVTLNTKHVTNNKKERARLKRDFRGKYAFTKDGYLKAHSEQGSQQIQVTRSVGHKLLGRLGVIPQPEMHRHIVRPQDKVLILGSDGIWDYLDEFDAVDIALELHPKEASCTIVSEAQGKAPDLDDIDNSTCIVATLGRH
eukprot:TRINITY_DN7466_c0_g1_i1.p1 TRINITY_DN7466_c0_g1~~TRINITY_DN7466_c0_g1_i1.p1  ORF type:complete len:425 (+),score=66.69 TRINITY_DN7466_c0_g1_i1:156-1277(+)